MKKLISLFIICSLIISTFGVVPVVAAEERLPFTDLIFEFSSGYLNVHNLWKKGIINGKSATKFAPNDPLTREEVAKIIVLATERDLVNTKGTFKDVKSGSWYEPYVETAVANDIVKGLGDGNFGVGSKITRQDAIVLIGRMADALGIKLEHVTPLTIVDSADIADYAKDYAKILVDFNAVDLDGSGKLLPKEDITRLDFCKYLDRVLISEETAYDDIIQDWVPVEKDVSELDANTLVYEDFEDGVENFVGTKPGLLSNSGLDLVVSDMGNESKSSMKITLDTPANLFFENIKPTTTYFVAYDIKVENLPGSADFARVNYEFGIGTGARQGAGYKPQNDIGGVTSDWVRQVHQVTSPTPDLAPQYMRLYFSVRGTSKEGCAWIDNLEIYEVVYEPVTTYLKLPAYKGLITDPEGESDIRLTSYITGMGSIYEPEKTKLVATVSDLDGKVLMSSEHIAPTKEMDVTFSSKSLEVGDYDLCSKLVDVESGKVYGENHYMLRKRPSDFKTKYRFDEYGRLLKDGKPWFPFGSYAYGNQREDLEDFKDTNIDLIICNSTSRWFLNYDLLKEWAKTDVKLLMTTDYYFANALRGEYQNPDITTIASERAVLDRVIDNLDLTNQEAFIGYGINNESSPLQWGRRMGWRNQHLAEKDFDHLTYGVSSGGPGVAAANSRMQDIYACDEPYPITGKADDPIWEVWEKSGAVAKESYNRPMWTVLQVSDLKLMGREPYISRKRGPNEEELRNMAWQAVCAGAQGIMYYAHFHVIMPGAGRPKSETFPEYLRVTDEVHAFEDVILSREDTPDLYAKADRMDRFAYTVRRYNGKTYVFLVNSDINSQTVSVKLDDVKSIEGVYNTKTKYKATEDGFIDVLLEPLGVEILVVDQPEPKSADCELKNIHFSNGEKNYFVSVVKDGDDAITVADCATEINYNVTMHKDATLKINGKEVTNKGTVSIEGVDKLTLTITSEDGKHKENYVYNIIRKPKAEVE